MPDPQLIDLLARGTAVTLLAMIVVALLNEWVYTRGRFLEMKADRDLYRRIALRQAKLIGKADSELLESDE